MLTKCTGYKTRVSSLLQVISKHFCFVIYFAIILRSLQSRKHLINCLLSLLFLLLLLLLLLFLLFLTGVNWSWQEWTFCIKLSRPKFHKTFSAVINFYLLTHERRDDTPVHVFYFTALSISDFNPLRGKAVGLSWGTTRSVREHSYKRTITEICYLERMFVIHPVSLYPRT